MQPWEKRSRSHGRLERIERQGPEELDRADVPRCAPGNDPSPLKPTRSAPMFGTTHMALKARGGWGKHYGSVSMVHTERSSGRGELERKTRLEPGTVVNGLGMSQIVACKQRFRYQVTEILHGLVYDRVDPPTRDTIRPRYGHGKTLGWLGGGGSNGLWQKRLLRVRPWTRLRSPILSLHVTAPINKKGPYPDNAGRWSDP